MEEKIIPKMVNYWKKTTVTKTDRQAYHSFGWLNGELESTVPTVEYPTVDDPTMVCFESHLVARLWLPPSKFLVAVMSQARYEKVVFSGIRLSLHRHRWDEYIPASFKGSWKGASRRWFLVDMHVQPQWENMHLLPPLIDDKRGKTNMTPRLAALVKRMAELRDSSLCAHHCAEEFTLQRIHPLGHREKLTYECLRLADPSCELATGRIFNFAFSCWWYVILI
jgi:hypothetical protein